MAALTVAAPMPCLAFPRFRPVTRLAQIHTHHEAHPDSDPSRGSPRIIPITRLAQIQNRHETHPDSYPSRGSPRFRPDSDLFLLFFGDTEVFSCHVCLCCVCVSCTTAHIGGLLAFSSPKTDPMVLHGAAPCWTVLHSAIQCCWPQHGAVQCCMVVHSGTVLHGGS